MMKKNHTMLAVICACLLMMTSVSALAESGLAGMPNPMVEATADEIAQKLNVTVKLPENAQDAAYFLYDVSPAMGEVQFTVDGIAYTYRVSEATAFEDISGMYVEFDATEEVSMGIVPIGEDGTCPCGPDAACEACDEDFCTCREVDGELRITEGAEGVALWFDEANGRMYSLSMASNADMMVLMSMANSLYLGL